ncbi:MAG: NADH-quinone oxidoreductase subunit L [Actinobacteria bacterium HGW-Actinobacteria-1]|jgi:NADH-quinone oxidoreductase subunit L|nr:MAG: NADH-quinone oxidoreductase subunit L [Actinobacteria bacterium HGW-Actinobacteria-1]
MSLFASNPWLAVAVPFVVAVVIAMLGRKAAGATQWIAVLAPLTAGLVGVAGLQGSVTPVSAPWLAQGSASIDVGVTVDGLSAIMLVVVGVVATMVVVFSVGYMAHDESKARYFSLLALFTAAMSLLVMSTSLVTLFVGWELVGACSYLLIGFWYRKPSAASAAVKAFLTTRVGDVGMLLGLALLWKSTGSLDIAAITAAAPGLAAGTATLAALLLFMGAAGKSAQFPLHIWLPDAMEGPTPVSALIHAATMVAAGVFLIARMWPLFEVSETARAVVLWIGVFTAIFAATIACVQSDIKKVLAYSTISQLGFMFAALGAGAWGAAMFHLVTHAAFKALLFLGSGSVIHGTGTQDIRQMGGLARRMPVTTVTWVVGVAALAGIPPLAGFFSKDAVLAGVFHAAPAAGVVLLGASLLTAFYAFRVTRVAFFGESRAENPAHESPLSMTGPLVALALLALVLGFLGGAILHALGLEAEGLETAVAGASVLVAVLGIGAGMVLYAAEFARADALRVRFQQLHDFVLTGWGFDALVQRVIVGPASTIAGWVYRVIDRAVIDGGVEGIGMGTRFLGKVASGLQSGETDVYASLVAVGFIVLMGIVLWAGR